MVAARTFCPLKTETFRHFGGKLPQKRASKIGRNGKMAKDTFGHNKLEVGIRITSQLNQKYQRERERNESNVPMVGKRRKLGVAASSWGMDAVMGRR